MLTIIAVLGLWPGPGGGVVERSVEPAQENHRSTPDPRARASAIAIGATPLLVRLHVGNFRFGSAKEDGGDLRFVGADDKTPLMHHVEKYDPLLGEALVWVNVPDLKPGTKSDIWLYYGNPKAPAAVDAKGTYDPDTLLVYHFAERGTPAQDVVGVGEPCAKRRAGRRRRDHRAGRAT